MWKLNSVIDMQGTNPYLVFVNNAGDTRLLPCKDISPTSLRTMNFYELENFLYAEQVKNTNKAEKLSTLS
ncbi:hypothetical protein HA38_03215 [Pantoea allii]|nr:hypothetical protein HA38_03215 [Pantoea allii]PBK00029.1 hypothetical protein CMR03_12780 [Pantoea allii]PBK00199.1 hypothetical protein CMR03_11540 [Pantoea allii]